MHYFRTDYHRRESYCFICKIFQKSFRKDNTLFDIMRIVSKTKFRYSQIWNKRPIVRCLRQFAYIYFAEFRALIWFKLEIVIIDCIIYIPT